MAALILRLCVLVLMMLGASIWPALASAALDPMQGPLVQEDFTQTPTHARRPSHAASPAQLSHLPRSDIPDGQHSPLKQPGQTRPGHGTALSAARVCGRSIMPTAQPFYPWACESMGCDRHVRRTSRDPSAVRTRPDPAPVPPRTRGSPPPAGGRQRQAARA